MVISSITAPPSLPLDSISQVGYEEDDDDDDEQL